MGEHYNSRPTIKDVVLDLPNGPENGGFLCFTVALEKGISFEDAVELSPSHVLLMLELANAQEEDCNKPASARGWRRAEVIAERLFWAPHTVRAYLTEIVKRIRKVISKRSQILPECLVIQRKRHHGARLSQPLRIDVTNGAR